MSDQTTNQDTAGDAQDTRTDGAQGDDFKSEHSKQSVLADLARTRDENKSMRAELDELKPLAEQMRALVGALVPDAKADDTATALTALEQRIADGEKRAAAAEHRALVAEHGEGLSDEDRGVLSKIDDPAVMAEVAKRLRDASANQPVGNGRYIPRPDWSAGQGGGEKPAGSVASGRDLYASRHGKN